MKRYLEKDVEQDLKEKMVFLGGPRQVGKTTLSFNLLNGDETHPAYLSWDEARVRKMLLRGELPGREPLLVLDEIHKYKGWRNLIKGFYDTQKSKRKFLVTGSARLDYYRRGGDSLQGRYHYYRLHPLSLSEVTKIPSSKDIQDLLEYGGFPEPFLRGSKRHWKRWQKERKTRVIQEDLIHLEQVKEISQISLLVEILPDRVGSPLSLNSLREDLSVSFKTVDRWIHILENLYYCYRILPYGPSRVRAAKKEKKLYLWDWSQCENHGSRFENFVASQLLKSCHYQEDTQGDSWQLCFLRDVYKREIDFVVLKNNKPVFAVECKTGEKNLSESICYFSERTQIPKFYQVHLGKKDVEVPKHRARILPWEKLHLSLGPE